MLLLLFACVTAENFPDKATVLVCERFQECDKGSFEATWTDVDDCASDNPVADYYRCLSDECEFVAGAASDCLSAYRGLSCEDVVSGQIPSACEDVYEGCDDIDYLSCAADAAF